MLPTVALVGRPNVGKSTLFNKLTRSRDALVADVPGLTRDRRYGRVEFEDFEATLIDTGGIFGEHVLARELTQQTQLAVDEADLVLLLMDGREGASAIDDEVVRYLRKGDIPFIPVINKIDGFPTDQVTTEFARFGFDSPVYIPASHSRGLKQLKDSITTRLQDLVIDFSLPFRDESEGIAVAVVGRPNVGKSTLVNRLIGEERQVVFDMPGTTKDAIDIPFSREGVDFVLIDTAGVRRKGKVSEITEKFSVVKALQAMQRAQVVIMVIDAAEGLVDQDLHILDYALDAGAGMVIAVNKWDGLEAQQRDKVRKALDRRLNFVPWVPVQMISALHGSGVGLLLSQVEKIHAIGAFSVSTTLLTRLLRNMVASHPAPSVRGRPIKLKVATRGGCHPPRIIVHGNQLASLPASYKRFLENGFREALQLLGNPVRVELRDSENPFAGRRNQLNQRQLDRRKRAIKHRKKSKR